MIGEYSECDKCLENNIEAKSLVPKIKSSVEESLRTHYGTSSLIDLLDHDIPVSIKSIIINDIKPPGPGNSTKWFNSNDINRSLKRISIKFSKMEGGLSAKLFGVSFIKELELRIPLYIPYQMRDFDKEKSDLHYLELSNWNCFGTVLNTDYSHGPGLHWVAIFVNLIKEPYTLEYFDSGGLQMMPEVLAFYKRLKEMIIKKYNPKEQVMIINVTNRVNQKDKHSCGSYALYYVYARLQGVPWVFFRDHAIGDTNMHKFRKHLFRLEE